MRPEHAKAIGDANRGRKQTPEHIANRSKAIREGQARKKLEGDAFKTRVELRRLEVSDKQSHPMKGKKATPEAIAARLEGKRKAREQREKGGE
jgi:hypothetical protein